MNDQTVERYYGFEPKQFPIVERLEVSQTLSDPVQQGSMSITIVLRSKNVTDKRRLTLTCSNVKDLHLRPYVQPLQFNLLEVMSIQEKQWEGIIYRIGNAEQDTEFAFVCSELDITLR